MNAKSWTDRIFPMTVALSGIADVHDEFGGHEVSCRLATRQGDWPIVSWIPARQIGTDECDVMVGEATVIDPRENLGRDPLVLIQWKPVDITGIFDVIPEDRSVTPGTVLQLCTLVKQMQSAPLRRFMAEVFAIPDVFHYFWTCPASISHHHCRAGGLATHSLEVAVASATVQVLDDEQRDLVVAYALLHDIGKLWSYDEGHLTEEASRIGHEQIGYCAVRSAIQRLIASDERQGRFMDALLSEAWKNNFRHPAAALGGIVRAMDRFSTAKYMNREARDSLKIEATW